MEKEILNKLKPHLIDREGLRLTVYKDSRGKPTVGLGHLVTPQDGLKIGDKITREKAEMLFAQDALAAIRAAIEQANKMGVSNIDFIVALSSVNFQLGTAWIKKFPNTWSFLRRGEYWQAISNIEKSDWAKQTPVRVRDFVSAITMLAHSKPPKNNVPKDSKVVKMNFNKKEKPK